MRDDGTMARGTRYTTEFRAKAVRLPSESRTSYSSGERDTDDGVGFLRGEARPDTALMAAYIDEHGDRHVSHCPSRHRPPAFPPDYTADQRQVTHVERQSQQL